MLTSKDIDRLTTVLATRNDLVVVKNDVSGLRELVQSLATSVDKLVKIADDFRTEYSVVGHQLDRHEQWIKQIAEKAGVKLK